MPRIKKAKISNESLLQKLQSQYKLSESYLSLFLGFLIVLVIGILVFNYFKGDRSDLGPAQQTTGQAEDVSADNLPGKYTVKEGDSLSKIAEHYYKDISKFSEIAKVNNLENIDNIEVGQVLEIPKLTEEVAQGTTEPTGTEEVVGEGTGGAENQTIWGEKIEGSTYTVVEGDWLSKIAGRAYGDIMAYPKIAEANNIANPDLIEPGVVLKIPR